MITKIIRAIGIFSIIILAVIFLFVYANFPNDLILLLDQSGEAVLCLSRSAVFFSSLAIMAFANISLIALIRLIKRSSEINPVITGWLWLFLNFVNLFFVISITFISILNGKEKFDYSNFGYLIYTSLLLLTFCVVGATTHWIILKINK